MRIDQKLHCFIKASETLHFARAAEKLHITPAALGKHIKNLECQIGIQLFKRTTRQVALTEMGERLYEHCKTISAQIDKLNQFVESKKDEPQGNLRVLVSTILARDWLLKHLMTFRQRFPKIELEFIFTEQDGELADTQADVMMGFPEIPPHTNELKSRFVFTVKNILCASPDYLRLHGPIKSKEDLFKADFISHTLRKSKNYLPLADGGCIPIPRPILFMSEFQALNQACVAGLGLFLTGDVLVQGALKEQQLIQLLPELTFREYKIYMFYQAYQYELPKVRAFLDFYTQHT